MLQTIIRSCLLGIALAVGLFGWSSAQALGFEEGADDYEAQAIVFGLQEDLVSLFTHHFTVSHFAPFPGEIEPNTGDRRNLFFEVDFETATFDLNSDGVPEVLVEVSNPGVCGSFGCTTHVLTKSSGDWRNVGHLTGASGIRVSDTHTNGYLDLLYEVRDYGGSPEDSNTYICKFEEVEYECVHLEKANAPSADWASE